MRGLRVHEPYNMVSVENAHMKDRDSRLFDRQTLWFGPTSLPSISAYLPHESLLIVRESTLRGRGLFHVPWA